MNVQLITSIESLIQNAAAWDGLWTRSGSSLPLTKARLLADFCHQFHAGDRFVAVVATAENRFVAALPLIVKRRGGFGVAQLPVNESGKWGEPMFDQQVDLDFAAETLVQGMTQLHCLMLQLDWQETETREMQALVNAAKRMGLSVSIADRFETGLFELRAKTGTPLQSRISTSFRKKLRKNMRRLSAQGSVATEVYHPIPDDDLDRLLDVCYEIEDCGWKGQSESSILRSAGMERFFSKVSQKLNDENELLIAMLNVDGKPIAFELGFVGGRTYHSWKIGYRPEFKSYSPGQLLTNELCLQLEVRDLVQQVDTLGPMAAASAKWSSFALQKKLITISSHRTISKIAVRGIDWVRKKKRSLSRGNPVTSYPLGACPT